MKKFYLLLSATILSASVASAQIYSNNFDESIKDDFLSYEAFIAGQNESDLIILSYGHDEWKTVNYKLNNSSNATPISMTSNDTVYVRARADFEGDVNPVLNIGLFDDQGVSPNNDSYNEVNELTLDKEWQILKFVVSDWNMTFGDPNDPNVGSITDSNSISSISFGPNTGFASQPSVNSLGEDINAAFEGTIYIDYISIGSDLEAGNELEVFTSYEHEFTEASLNDITSSASFVNTVEDGSLMIESAGHDQWESISFPVTDGVVDISSGLELTFEASSSVTSSTDAPIGFMIVAVDELGTRIQYPELFTVKGLTTTPQEIVVDFGGRYEYVAEGTTRANPKRIASFEILINQGFASEWFSTNDLGQSVNEAYVGTITVSNLGFSELINGVSSKNENLGLAFFPNPANSVLNIADEKLNGATYSVTDLIGTQVQSGELSNSAIEIHSLATGSYVVSLTKDGLVYSSVFMKE